MTRMLFGRARGHWRAQLSQATRVWLRSLRREEHGRTVLERLAKDDPAKLAQIAYGLLPRDVRPLYSCVSRTSERRVTSGRVTSNRKHGLRCAAYIQAAKVDGDPQAILRENRERVAC
jgi:hypothetical protein